MRKPFEKKMNIYSDGRHSRIVDGWFAGLSHGLAVVVAVVVVSVSLSVGVGMAGCSKTEEKNTPDPVEPDWDADVTGNVQLPDGCSLGERTCIAAAVVARCVEMGAGHGGGQFDLGQCPEGHGCRDGQCFPSVCEPGEFVECVDDTTERRCDLGGTRVLEQGCQESDTCGDTNGCAGVVACIPNIHRCAGEEKVEICNESGNEWSLYQDCRTGATGSVCQNGECITLCQKAAKESSYMGCEYWAADLDNAFVEGNSPTGYYDAQGAQYAIIVSNVHRTLAATVELDGADGKLWCRPWDALPGTPFTDQPDAVWCQVGEEKCNTEPRCSTVVKYDSGDRAFVEQVCINTGGGECVDTLSVPPLQLRVLNLPRRDVMGTSIEPKAFRVKSSVPISAYQFNPLENEGVYSNDASLLLPVETLGREHLIMTREQTFYNLRSFITVIAVKEGPTNVIVRVAAPTIAGSAGNASIEPMEAGEMRSFTLQQYDVLNIETRCTPDNNRNYCKDAPDLTGSEVYSNRPVAVFGGSEAANAPNTNHCIDLDGVPSFISGNEGYCYDYWNPQVDYGTQTKCMDNSECYRFITCCADHLEQQIYPLSAWGRHYLLSKASPRGEEEDVYRVMAGVDGTVVDTYPWQAEIPVLNRGEWFEFESVQDFEMQANKPILVGQFLAAEQAPHPNARGKGQLGDANTGDPAFILAVPIEQFRDNYVFLTPDKYAEDYVNILTPAGNRILLDGEPVSFDSFSPIGDGRYTAVRVQLQPGVHMVRSLDAAGGVASGEPFSIIVYGFDRYVSYGFAGGLDLGRINYCGSDLDCPEATRCVEGDCVPR